jgi:hypothetical protein
VVLATVALLLGVAVVPRRGAPEEEKPGWRDGSEPAPMPPRGKDYYKVLQLYRNASQHEVKKAYRARCLQWHPDKVAPEWKELAEANMLAINEAVVVLSDGEKRRRYDNGEQAF